jgi:glycosyltransferase involved in cell wall biosynthesis
MQTVQQRDLTPHVTLVPDTLSVAQYMTGAMDCFVFPSRYEGLGLVAAEAQAAGLPCLISERVPQEAIIDPALVRVLPLQAGADTWAEAATALPAKISSQDPRHLAKLDSSRFEINMSMQKLAELYQRVVALPNGRSES